MTDLEGSKSFKIVDYIAIGNPSRTVQVQVPDRLHKVGNRRLL